LILEAFVGPCPDGLRCLHADGNSTNNTLANLRWGTAAENSADSVRHGTSNRGERHPLAKLTEWDVREIRRKRAEGATTVSIAGEYGVTACTITDVCNRKTWWYVD
jgi:hypothetical protein